MESKNLKDDALKGAIDNNYTGAISKIYTEFKCLDKAIDGFHKGQLVVIAGRQGMAQQTFTLNLVRNLCLIHQKPIAYFAWSMNAVRVMEILFKQLVSYFTEIDSENEKRITAYQNISKSPLILLQDVFYEINDFAEYVKNLMSEKELEVIVLNSNVLVNSNQDLFRLKKIAQKLNILIIMNQSIPDNEENPSKIPKLNDFYPKSETKNFVDYFLLLYRPEFYKIQKWENGDDCMGEALVKIYKQDCHFRDVKFKFNSEKHVFRCRTKMDDLPF